MAGNDFGRWLQKQLDRRQWTQADFVRAGDFSRSGVSAWIRGERVPDPAYCDLIADVLGVDVDLVLTMAGHRPALDPVKEGSVEAELISLIRRVKWNDERASGVRLILRNYIEFDRERQQE